ncbi:ShlB/FhaC/HecB family hemolysin secretion/activation protein [Aquabacterium sp. OR-4]|uniref:ShlB/FhaC/HecB family hemolysin secretion/activation protein n=1 Tax=Aquabacterium sp. OR-4 TaxID=2978127 RepID=UPI0028C78005|nr:ShlB/FhaC/HecB family hemolysin secretion/activation protein [Aquabacterium sp. OR-4]MDT7838933.1 ShlB/FhaC/HecB family hemolysin secretion/activation protein [Aquabacterium sp. OR-4]
MPSLCLALAGLSFNGAHAQPQTPDANATAPAVRATATAEPARFDILAYVVQGDSVLGAAAIERAVYPYLGPDKTVADAEGARRALEKAYQDAGYLSVNVLLPPQRVDQAGGELRLQVLQAVVDQLRVTGAQYTLPSKMREALPALARGEVPDFNLMQQQLAQYARTSADRDITPLISAGTQPGTMNVELKVQESLPLHAGIELNSKQSQNTSAGRLEADVRYDNLFQRGHSLGLNWLVSPTRPQQANIPSLTYQVPLAGLAGLGGPGDTLTLAWLHSNSNTPTALGGGTVSRGSTTRLRWRDELGGGGEGISHALTWGLTLRRLRDANQDVAGFTTASPALNYSTLSLAYELDLGAAVLGGLAGRSTRAQLDLSLGLAALNRRQVDCGGTQTDQFACKRSGASPGFQTLGLQLSHTEPLGRWQLLVRLQGQLADAPLVPAEQVVYGGLDSVRGYYEGEQAGDMGLALRGELSAPAWQVLAPWQLRPLGFVEGARLLKIDALAGELGGASLASAGLGLRVQTAFGLQASLSWARVLRSSQRLDSKGVPETLTGAATGRGQRWDLSVRQSF